MLARGLIFLSAWSGLLGAQDAARLREAFEGKNVVLRLDMPATKDGVDIYPERSTPLDFRSYQMRVKNCGISIRQGESIMVTKVLVKEKLIEFQLGGGGYGTFADDSGTTVSPSYEGRSKREKDLEEQMRTATGDQRRSLERDLDSLRRERERSNARTRAEAAQAEEMAKARIEQKRKDGGSRFNIRFEPRVPASAATPEGLVAALSTWVEFADEELAARGVPIARGTEARRSITTAGAVAAPAGGLPILRKGMSRAGVDAILGAPIDVTERNEGAIQVSTAVYDVSGVTGKVDFANGVLVKFSYHSR